MYPRTVNESKVLHRSVLQYIYIYIRECKQQKEENPEQINDKERNLQTSTETKNYSDW